MIEAENVRRAADELVTRYGSHALSVARERVQSLSQSGDQQAADIAMRVLTEVERLVADMPEGS